MKKALKFFAVLLVLFFLYVGYGRYREPIAEKQARDFCGSVKVGASVEGVSERAIQAGAEPGFAKWHGNHVRTFTAIFVGMPPFSRHVCLITASEVVISATYEHSD